MSDNLKNKLYVWAVFTVGGLIFGAFLVPIFGFEKAFYVFLTYSRIEDNLVLQRVKGVL